MLLPYCLTCLSTGVKIIDQGQTQSGHYDIAEDDT